MDDITEVLKAVTIVRKIMEETSTELTKGVGIFPPSRFPRGWCQDTSRALGHLLADRGQVGFHLIFANRANDDRKTHVWLERDGLIVDITADQFEGAGCPGVMVTKDRAWHDGWVCREQELDDVLAGHADCAIYVTVSNHPTWNKQPHCG